MRYIDLVPDDYSFIFNKLIREVIIPKNIDKSNLFNLGKDLLIKYKTYKVLCTIEDINKFISYLQDDIVEKIKYNYNKNKFNRNNYFLYNINSQLKQDLKQFDNKNLMLWIGFLILLVHNLESENDLMSIINNITLPIKFSIDNKTFKQYNYLNSLDKTKLNDHICYVKIKKYFNDNRPIDFESSNKELNKLIAYINYYNKSQDKNDLYNIKKIIKNLEIKFNV